MTRQNLLTQQKFNIKERDWEREEEEEEEEEGRHMYELKLILEWPVFMGWNY